HAILVAHLASEPELSFRRLHARQRADRAHVGDRQLRIVAPLARVIRAVARLEAHWVPADEERRRTGLLEIARHARVDAVNCRRDHDDHEHANRDAEDGERRTHLVGAQRVEGDRHALEHVVQSNREAAHQVSCRMAATGSSNAARLAGYAPAMMPTPAPTATPTMIDHSSTAAGNGDTAAMSFASPIPRPTPIAAPSVASAAASTRNCRRMSLRRAPSAFRMPISCVRSATATSMMFMITIAPTTSPIAGSATPAMMR